MITAEAVAVGTHAYLTIKAIQTVTGVYAGLLVELYALELLILPLFEGEGLQPHPPLTVRLLEPNRSGRGTNV